MLRMIDDIIKENIHSFLLREYLDKDYMMPLMNNLNMDRKDKVWQNVRNNLDMCCDYLGLDYEEILQQFGEEEDDKALDKCTEYLMQKYPDEIEEYCNTLQAVYAEDFNTNLMLKDAQLFKNGWLIHLTNKPYTILRDGFHGLSTSLINRLWRTYGYGYHHESGKGYAFAYDVNDKIDENYGEYGIIFRGSGIKVHNRVDGDNQVIFSVESVNLRDCYLMHIVATADKDSYNPYDDYSVMTYDYTYEIIDPKTQKVFFRSEDYSKAIQWVINNGRQYKKINSSHIENERFIKTQKEEAIANVQKIIDYIDQNSKQYVMHNTRFDINSGQRVLSKYAELLILVRNENANEQYFSWRDMMRHFHLKKEWDEHSNIVLYNDLYKIKIMNGFIDNWWYKRMAKKYGEDSVNEGDIYCMMQIEYNFKQ